MHKHMNPPHIKHHERHIQSSVINPASTSILQDLTCAAAIDFCISCICTQQVSCHMFFCRRNQTSTAHCATAKLILLSPVSVSEHLHLLQLSHTSSHITLLLYDPFVYLVYFSSSHRSVFNPFLPPSLFIPTSLLCFFLWILRRCPTSLLLLNIQSGV